MIVQFSSFLQHKIFEIHILKTIDTQVSIAFEIERPRSWRRKRIRI